MREKEKEGWEKKEKGREGQGKEGKENGQNKQKTKQRSKKGLGKEARIKVEGGRKEERNDENLRI